MRRILSLALALIIAAPAFAQTTRHSQIVLKCRASSRLSVSGESVIYKKCSDGKLYVSSEGGAYTEITTASPTSPAWQTRAFSAGNYQALAPMTWTVEAGDRATETWQFTNDTLVTFVFNYATTTIGGTPNHELRVTLPFTSAETFVQPIHFEQTSALSDDGFAVFVAGSSTMYVYRPNYDAWNASTNTTFVRAVVQLRVTP